MGTLSTTDQDAGDSHTYSLVSGTGDGDNGSFTISGSTLQTNAAFDFEAKPSYSVRVRTDDGHGGTFEKQLSIAVGNVNEAPVITAPTGTISVTKSTDHTFGAGAISIADVDAGPRDLEV